MDEYCVIFPHYSASPLSSILFLVSSHVRVHCSHVNEKMARIDQGMLVIFNVGLKQRKEEKKAHILSACGRGRSSDKCGLHFTCT